MILVRPVWLSSYADANPIINGGVGELSAMWSTYKQQYLVAYFDFQKNGAGVLRIGNSSNPYGPFDTSTILFDSSKHYPWMQNDWYGPYGGYLIHDQGNTLPIVYITLSLLVPYRVFIMTVNLDQVYNQGTDIQPYLNTTMPFSAQKV